MAAKIYLNTIEKPEDGDTSFVFPKMPAFRNDEDESLACGHCKTVVGRNISTRTIYNMISVDKRLVVRCDCERRVIVPATVKPGG